MKTLMLNLERPIFERNVGHNVFNQLAVKVVIDHVKDEEYFAWLDRMIDNAENDIGGIRFLEKEGVRSSPPLNTAVYYDTDDYKLLPTGALLRTSCNVITHAFCAFKLPEDQIGNRLDRRHVFEGDEKRAIQESPFSARSTSIVRRLLARTDIAQPGTFLRQEYGIVAGEVTPAIVLCGHRSTFYVRIDDYDALRCSIDRSTVFDARRDPSLSNSSSFREIEISIYPRIRKEIAPDPRVVQAINYLVASLLNTFNASVTYDIKYQRAAKSLGIRYADKATS